VLLLSGILLPLTYAPGWLQGIATWNPFSWAVDGTRALFRGDLGAPDVWQGRTHRGNRDSSHQGRTKAVSRSACSAR
jgi:hypothetical protein